MSTPNTPHPAVIRTWIACQDLWDSCPNEAPSEDTVPQPVMDALRDLWVEAAFVLATGGYSIEALRVAFLAAGRADLVKRGLVDEIIIEDSTQVPPRRRHKLVHQLTNRITSKRARHTAPTRRTRED